MIEDIPLLVRADVHVLHKNLAVPDDGITVLEICPAGPQRLDLRALQCQTGFKGFMDEEIMTCLAILADDLYRDIFLPNVPHLAVFPVFFRPSFAVSG